MCIPTIIMIMDSTYSHIYSDASILIGEGYAISAWPVWNSVVWNTDLGLSLNGITGYGPDTEKCQDFFVSVREGIITALPK